jgi:hypothetical protein
MQWLLFRKMHVSTLPAQIASVMSRFFRTHFRTRFGLIMYRQDRNEPEAAPSMRFIVPFLLLEKPTGNLFGCGIAGAFFLINDLLTKASFALLCAIYILPPLARKGTSRGDAEWYDTKYGTEESSLYPILLVRFLTSDTSSIA